MITKQDWLACPDAAMLSEQLQAEGSDRQLWLFAAACLRRVWSVLEHDAAYQAIEIMEQYADDLVHREEIHRVWSNAEWELAENLWLGPNATRGAWWDDKYGNWAEPTSEEEADRISQGVCEALDEPAWIAARAVFHARELAVWQAQRDQQAAVLKQEQQAQFGLLLDLLGNPSQPAWVDHRCLTTREQTVGKLAATAYQQRDLPSGLLDNVLLAILSDALEEAGCTDSPILDHLRQPGIHVRGCWAVDALLQRR